MILLDSNKLSTLITFSKISFKMDRTMGSNMAVTAELVIHIESKHAIIIKANMSLDTAAIY